MAYATLDDIRERLPEESLVNLTDDSDSGQVDEAAVARAIADADAEIEGYLAQRHQVPLSPPVPNLVRKLSVELAIYHLHSRRGGAPEEWRTRYEDGRRLLENIARGLVSLGLTVDDGQPADGAAQASSAPRIFSRSGLRDF